MDFGQGAAVIEDGRRRRPHLFRVTLSFSRKGYSEVVWRQDTETFLRCLENAFRSFGGVPKTIVVDNLKAAVLQADWFDPEINPNPMTRCERLTEVAGSEPLRSVASSCFSEASSAAVSEFLASRALTASTSTAVTRP